MSDTSTLLRLSDNFDTWRDKINKQIDDFITLSERVTNITNIPANGSIGLILTNTSDNTPYWEDLKTLLNRLGIEFSTVDELISANLDSLQAKTINASQSITCEDTSGNINKITPSGVTFNNLNVTNAVASTFSGKNLTLTDTTKAPYLDLVFGGKTSTIKPISNTTEAVLSINGHTISPSNVEIKNASLTVSSTNKAMRFITSDTTFAFHIKNTQLYPIQINYSDAKVTIGSLLSGTVNINNKLILNDDTKNTKLTIENSSNAVTFKSEYKNTNKTETKTPLSIDIQSGLISCGYNVNISNNLTLGNSLTLGASGTLTHGETTIITSNGRVYGAVFNDYAEFFEKGEETEVGDIIALDTDSKEERYIKATNPRTIVGVHSDTYGHILGGFESIESSEESFIPVGMSGRVKTKIIGPIEKGDEVVLSKYPGIGRKYYELTDRERDIIGFAVETNLSEDIKLVRIKI